MVLTAVLGRDFVWEWGENRIFKIPERGKLPGLFCRRGRCLQGSLQSWAGQGLSDSFLFELDDTLAGQGDLSF